MWMVGERFTHSVESSKIAILRRREAKGRRIHFNNSILQFHLPQVLFFFVIEKPQARISDI